MEVHVFGALDHFQSDEIRHIRKLFGMENDPEVRPFIEELRSNELVILRKVLMQMNESRQLRPSPRPGSCPRCGKNLARTRFIG